MTSRPDSPGTVTLMGSGELTRPMSKVHRRVASAIRGRARAAILDTPAGFELNADEIAERACAYVTEYVGLPCSVASFRSSQSATTQEIESTLRKLTRAQYIFAGPGSPTYAVRNWRNTPVFDLVARRIHEGAHLVLASAAAIAVGRYTLPVYEIYKVGEDPHWVQGLDLLAPYGLELAIVSHWNNAEGGTFDTRYCYMGQPRFDLMERLLPDSTTVLGIDEYTACIIDLGAGECWVMGAGEVTVRRAGQESKFEAGTSFSLDLLRGPSAHGETAPKPALWPEAKPVATGKPPREALLRRITEVEEHLVTAASGLEDLSDLAGEAYDLARATDEAREAGVDDTVLSEARAAMRRLLITWADRLAPTSAEAVANMAPLVDLLIALRSGAREARNWALADEIRDRLSELGISLEDGPSGTAWRKR
jgi:hypothetical protein